MVSALRYYSLTTLVALLATGLLGVAVPSHAALNGPEDLPKLQDLPDSVFEEAQWDGDVPPMLDAPRMIPCADSLTFFKGKKEKKTCKWIASKRKKRRRKLCGRKKVRNNCPEACNVKNCYERVAPLPTPEPLTTCPREFTSDPTVAYAVPYMDRIPDGQLRGIQFPKSTGLDCSRYQDGLECFSNYRLDGCSEDGLQCTPWTRYSCSNDVWQQEFIPSDVCPEETSSSTIRSRGQVCDPKACPESKPEVGTDCSTFLVDNDCPYDYKVFGCEGEDEECFPTSFFRCGEDDTWLMSKYAMPMCPDNTPQGFKSCDPKKCPDKEPVNGSSCSFYQGSDDCDYDHKVMGCSADTQQCSPSKYYTCDEDPIGRTEIWRMSYALSMACWTGGDGASCDPNGCPIQAPLIGSDCSAYQGVEKCMYNYLFTAGCTIESMQCNPTDYFSCDAQDNTWARASMAVATPICQSRSAVELPMGKPCEKCPSVEPADRCPSEKPSPGTRCVDVGYENGLTCNYDFEYFGCTEDELKCTPINTFQCTRLRGWTVKTQLRAENSCGH